MQKEEFIKGLKNLKVVLGNGFDLYCGLKTRYYDYFLWNYKNYYKLLDWYYYFQNTGKFNADAYIDALDVNTVWDFFFILNLTSIQKTEENWCDVERLIKSSLTHDYSGDTFLLKYSLIHWNTINRYISSDREPDNDLDSFMVNVCQKRIEHYGFNKNKFYYFLLEELKTFERNFGMFIRSQIYDGYFETIANNYGYTKEITKKILNAKYISNCNFALDFITDLKNETSISSIDTFNYSVIDDVSIKNKMHHINGSFEHPIFGVDSIFDPSKQEYMFTKTSRRIDSDLIDPEFDKEQHFENVVIFGHSLNEADYSYFFPIFDKIGLDDNTSASVVVFVYTIYNPDKENEIRTALRNNISRMIYNYSLEKGNEEGTNRLLDSLSTQRRIITYEIPCTNNTSYTSFSELNWTKKMDEFKTFLEYRKESKYKCWFGEEYLRG